MIDQAIKIMDEAHQGQTRWGGEPYIVHPLRVAAHFSKLDTRVVALLHDVIEDCAPEKREYFAKLIEEIFGEGVLNSIMIVTKRPLEDYGVFIERVADSDDINAIAVKREDLRDNMRDLDQDSKRYRKYFTALERLSE